MAKEPLTRVLTINVSAADKERLAELSQKQGATLSGYVRWLIRREASASKESANAR